MNARVAKSQYTAGQILVDDHHWSCNDNCHYDHDNDCHDDHDDDDHQPSDDDV